MTGSHIPDLAVIIPARNEASRLGGCLDSVRQALEHAEVADAEVVVVDDASTDQTFEVAQAHGALAIRQSRRLGPLEAWSCGVAGTSGSLAGFCRRRLPCRYRKPSLLFYPASLSPPSGLRSRHAANLTGGGPPTPSWERSATFSALMLHEVKSRLVNHDFLPIGRLMAVRRAAWQDGGHGGRATGHRLARKTGGMEIFYTPDALVYYGRSGHSTSPVRLPSDDCRTITSNRGWAESLPRRVAARAASASLRQQPLNGAAWLTFRARLWSERAVGLMRPNEAMPAGAVPSPATGRCLRKHPGGPCDRPGRSSWSVHSVAGHRPTAGCHPA